MEEKKAPRTFNKWLYQKEYDFWYWFALRVLGIPFIMVYNPPPGKDVLAITFSWTKDYVERVQRNFTLEAEMAEVKEALRIANETIAVLEDEKARSEKKNGSDGL